MCEKFSRFSIQLILRLFSFHSSLTAKNLEIHLLCGYLAAVMSHVIKKIVSILSISHVIGITNLIRLMMIMVRMKE